MRDFIKAPFRLRTEKKPNEKLLKTKSILIFNSLISAYYMIFMKFLVLIIFTCFFIRFSKQCLTSVQILQGIFFLLLIKQKKMSFGGQGQGNFGFGGNGQGNFQGQLGFGQQPGNFNGQQPPFQQGGFQQGGFQQGGFQQGGQHGFGGGCHQGGHHQGNSNSPKGQGQGFGGQGFGGQGQGFGGQGHGHGNGHGHGHGH